VIFSAPTSQDSAATFPASGIYVLQLAADDGSIQRSDQVEVRVESLCTVEEVPALAGWWPGNGTSQDIYNKTSAILMSGANYSTGQVATAFNFDGVNDHVFVAAMTNYDIGQNLSGITVEFWVKAQNAGASRGILSWNNGVANGVHIYQSSANLIVNVVQNNGTSRVLPTVNTVFNGTWRHIALTYDKTSGWARVYVDGGLAVSQNITSFTPQTQYDLYFGQVVGFSPLLGQLDEVSVYRRPLNPEEINNVFVSGAVGKCPVDDNAPPFVYAGQDRFVTGTNSTIELEGEASDDGLPLGIR
jgi:hypothetical protein